MTGSVLIKRNNLLRSVIADPVGHTANTITDNTGLDATGNFSINAFLHLFGPTLASRLSFASTSQSYAHAFQKH